MLVDTHAFKEAFVEGRFEITADRNQAKTYPKVKVVAKVVCKN